MDKNTNNTKIEKNPSAKVPGHEGTLLFLKDMNVDNVLCSGMGTPALLFAKELDIKVCYARAKNVSEMLDMYENGMLEDMHDGSPCIH